MELELNKDAVCAGVFELETLPDNDPVGVTVAI